jgi:hypothetical protein
MLSAVRLFPVLAWLIAGTLFPILASGIDELDTGFTNPPASARPWAYWFWLDGDVSRAGLTADLEAMQRAGLGGAVLFNASQGLPLGPARFGSPEWRELLKHSISEARRLGLEIDLHNAPGWSGSGGPWITPAQSMQVLVSTKTNLTGPIHFHGALPEIRDTNHCAVAVATVAFPALVGEGAPLPGFSPKVTASVTTGFNGTNLTDHSPATWVTLPRPSPRKPQFVQFEFEAPFFAADFKLSGRGKPQGFQGMLQISDDNRHFRTVREFINQRSILALEFEPVSARFFRWVFTQADESTPQLDFSELELTPVYRIELSQTKSGLGPLPASVKDADPGPEPPSYSVIDPARLVDLSASTSPEGMLEWDVPPGLWTVLRFACVPNGRSNHPAPAGGEGLESDKLSREATAAHFARSLDPVIADVGNNAGSALAATHIDSWEIGFQNWTPKFRAEFRGRRGYDPLPFLPAVTGRIVGSREQSERFLWDMRRTIADLLADNYAGELANLAHQHGMQLSIEAYSSLGSGPFDDLLYAAKADVPMSEFWLDDGALDRLSLKSMPSAAHTGGKPIVAAEAFTSTAAFAKWQEHPFSLKPLGDAAFCQGINRLIFHQYTHQPWLERAPGLTLGPFGVHYDRTETWWEQARAWHQYLARCQFLLQQGLFVADICYLTDEGAYTSPPTPDQLQPRPPAGHDYDLATAETVLTRMSVKDGRLQLPDGMNYGLLVLPPNRRMTPKLLAKIKELVEAGATVLGARPIRSPSLTGYPQCDNEVVRLADELWGPCDGKAVKEHALGKGKIVWGLSLEEVLRRTATPQDLQQVTQLPGYALRYIHRRTETADIYFVANPNASMPRAAGAPSTDPTVAECRFRITGKQPEIWHPDTGQLEKPAIWHEADGMVTLPIPFEPAGSLFVIFRESSRGLDPILRATMNGRPVTWLNVSHAPSGQIDLLSDRAGLYRFQCASGRTLAAEIKPPPAPMPVQGPWELSFPPHLGAPDRVTLERLISWSNHTNPGVKYFSGTASYKKLVSVPSTFLAADRQVYLDLGKVQVIAEVSVNGVDCGVLWKPPFVADISKVLKAGDNLVEIKVVNLWPNRLIGDEQLPDDCRWLPAQSDGGQGLAEWPRWLLDGKTNPSGRVTFTTWKHWAKDSPLLDSGLLGPVTLRVADHVALGPGR